MRVTKNFPSFNHRRFGRPWIAVVANWPVGGRPELRFGFLVGGYQGQSSVAEIDAEPGAIIRYGQRDHRGSHSTSFWAIVQDDGSLVDCSAEEAREKFLSGRGP